jgi:hypothetical protein
VVNNRGAQAHSFGAVERPSAIPNAKTRLCLRLLTEWNFAQIIETDSHENRLVDK